MERKLIADFVKENLAEERTGHDYYHGKRVAVLAERMLLADHPEAGQKSRDIAYTAGFVHDTIDEKVCPNPSEVLAKLREVFTAAGLSASDQDNVFFAIEHMSFSKNIDRHYRLSLEGEYVQDADRLESLPGPSFTAASTMTRSTIRKSRRWNWSAMINTGIMKKLRSIIFMKSFLSWKG